MLFTNHVIRKIKQFFNNLHNLKEVTEHTLENRVTSYNFNKRVNINVMI